MMIATVLGRFTECHGTINRSDFGLTWQQRLAAGGLLVREEVTILIDVSAEREEG
jgi:polyisoprenoid-binding protein YceI